MSEMSYATSNERHRIQKLMRGNDGTTFYAAHDEKVDDAIDAGATRVHSIFHGGNITSIHNNGRHMTEKDMHSYIQLDSEKTEGTKKQIGKHGIGSMKARCRFAGEKGKEITTSVNQIGRSVQVSVDMLPLLDENQTEINCWTGDSGHRPKWTEFDNSEGKYKEGVTTEYNSETNHNFEKEALIYSEMKKYQNYDNIKIQHTFYDGDKTYNTTVPKLVSSDTDMVTTTSVRVRCYCNDKGKPTYVYDLCDGGISAIGPKGTGYGPVDPTKVSGKPEDTKLVFKFPNIEKFITKEHNEPKYRSYEFMNAISKMSDSLSIEDNNIIVDCGEYTIVDAVEVPKKTTEVHHTSLYIKDKLFSSVNIQQGNRILTDCSISIWKNKKRCGDIDAQDLYEYTSKTWVIPGDGKLNVTEETKSKVTLDQYPGFDKVLSEVFTSFNKYLSKEMTKAYEKLLSEEEMKKKKEEKKKKKEEKKAKTKAKEGKAKEGTAKECKAKEEIVTKPKTSVSNSLDKQVVEKQVVEEQVVEDKVVKDIVVKDKVVEDKVVKDKVVEDKVVKDIVVEELKKVEPKKVNSYYKGSIPKKDAISILKKYIEYMENLDSDFTGGNMSIINAINKEYPNIIS